MADFINLRMARKRRDRADAAGKADIKRAAHGRTRTEKDVVEAERNRLARLLDQAERER